MLIHELTRAECRETLARTNVARLACARDNQPYVVPILFSFDPADDCLYCFSTLGLKIEWMRHNPKVCVEIDDITDPFHWTTIVVLGRYEEILRSADASRARKRARELFETRPEWWLPGAAHLADSEHEIPVVYRIHADIMTGRQADRPPVV